MDNSGAFAPYLIDVTGTTAIAFGKSGRTCQFFRFGHDDVGHVVVVNTTPEASVTVNATSIPVLPMVSGGFGVSRDLDDEGRHEDCHANGRIDFADFVWLFNHL